MLDKIFTKGVEGVMKVADSIIDQFVESDEDRLNMKVQLGSILQAREAMREESFQKQMEMQRDILVAEMKQDDKFTKRARPTIIYFGLFLFAIHLLAPLFGGQTAPIPVEFTSVWGGVCGLYVWGRSREKQGADDRLQQILYK